MKLLKALKWLDDHLPSTGFYRGKNPWDSSDKDAKIEELKVVIGHRDCRIGALKQCRNEERMASERIILSLAIQKEELQRTMAANEAISASRSEMIGRLQVRVSELEAQLCREQQSRERVKELEAFAKNIRDDYDCDSDAHKYQNGIGCRCCDAEKLLSEGDEEGNSCEGCGGECGICATGKEKARQWEGD